MKILARQVVDLDEENIAEVFRHHLDTLCDGELDHQGKLFRWKESGHGNTIRHYSLTKPTQLQLAALKLRAILRRKNGAR